MAFWIEILVAGLFAYLAVRIGFYEIWALLFNTTVSIYLGLFLGPSLAEMPMLWAAPLSLLFCVIGTTIGSFLILQGLTYALFTSQFVVDLPKILDLLGAGIVGFFTGFLIWAFVSIMLFGACMDKVPFVNTIGFNKQFQKTAVANVGWWTGIIHTFADNEQANITTDQYVPQIICQIRQEIEKWKGTNQNKPLSQDVNTPSDTNKPPDSNSTKN